MTETELRAEIKRGPAGGYLLWGDEDYLKQFYLSALRNAALSGSTGSRYGLTKAAASAKSTE